ncbi:hypothetical protein FSP39_002048 [Pinctada imbricata]|uniref:CYTH domain-containing protein n=1 Tax=Pinctada imbricata TaxID=66713 RepID=A0AA88XQ01_PINIB|nr:hypothetical protein FSP39_002048 [Pinctada imbricata]
MREVHSSSQRDGIFEFTSHTSNMLQFEKSRKMEHSVGRKRKELSPLTIEDSSVGEVGLEVKESVPQQCSEDIQVSETRQDEQPMSPTTFTRDSKQHLIFEEDEENVIIHLETDFEQEDDTAMKEAQTAEISLAEKPSLQSEKKALDIGGLDTVPGSAVSNPIEVERKFTVTADTKIRLLELGAELRKEKTFKDAYYDNSDYRLTLSDCWLRQRNGTWEFKVAVSSFIKPSSSTQYSEITDENEICRLLHRKFDVKDDVVMSLNELIDKLKLDVFAKFTTTRQTYFLPECTIDLDLADFGFQVGEIEVMIADEKRIPEALQTIDSVASKLGKLYI